jgi:putative acetyltransferase
MTPIASTPLVSAKNVTQSTPFLIRPIAAQDDAAVQHIIESVMPEFGANGAGFAIHDPEVKAMFAAYQIPGARYFVVEFDGHIAGAGGVADLVGVAGTCELRKMYFLPELRGLGAGRALMQNCVQAAREHGYRHIYLETLTGMDAAVKLYERTGFQRLAQAMGATGHYGCNRFYLLNL